MTSEIRSEILSVLRLGESDLIEFDRMEIEHRDLLSHLESLAPEIYGSSSNDGLQQDTEIYVKPWTLVFKRGSKPEAIGFF